MGSGETAFLHEWLPNPSRFQSKKLLFLHVTELITRETPAKNLHFSGESCFKSMFTSNLRPKESMFFTNHLFCPIYRQCTSQMATQGSHVELRKCKSPENRSKQHILQEICQKHLKQHENKAKQNKTTCFARKPEKQRKPEGFNNFNKLRAYHGTSPNDCQCVLETLFCSGIAAVSKKCCKCCWCTGTKEFETNLIFRGACLRSMQDLGT